jgi:hypothetical protein
VLSLSSSLPAHASGDQVDQAQTLTIGLQRSIPVLAQTFTAGMTGQLDRVSIAYDTGGSTRLRVSIRTTSAGVPTGSVVGGPVAWSGTVVCCRQFHDFTLNPAVSLTSGVKYAIVIETISGVFTWYSSASIDAYANGQLFVDSTWLTGSQWGMDFAFKTWVAASANQPPSVAADNVAVSAPEGTSPANTGTYVDPDGDTVALTASSGSVTRAGTSSGTWSWTQPASDEGPAQTVTITAADGQGHTSTTSFTTVVAAVAPTAQIVTDPPSIPEGSPETFTGAAKSPAAPDNTAGFTYSWTVTKNGNAYAGGASTSFTFTPDDEGTYVVTFRATDDGGMSGTDSMTVIGTNVAPKAAIAGFAQTAPVITAQELLTFNGSFSDAGALDSHVATWSFGDGATSVANLGVGGSANLSASHAYAGPGTYTVTLTVVDDDGGVGKATTQVQVMTTAQALSWVANEVRTHTTLSDGLKNSLIAKLNAASAAAARGDTTAANNQLNAFLNELQADVNTGKVSAGEAATLRNAVHAVKGTLGTFNRFLEWWPLGL